MATNTGKRKCKNCGEEFVKTTPLDYVCSHKCYRAYNNAINKKKSTYSQSDTNAPLSKKYKEKTPIKNVSQTNRYAQSDGTKITSAALEKNISKAKELKILEMTDNYGYVFCEDCNEFGLPPEPRNEMELKIIDCSHQISVDEAKKSGRSELAYNIDYIRMRCRIHHKIHDKTI